MAGWAGGVYTRARNWAQDKLNSINPQAALLDQEDDTIAAGLNNCVTKDGTSKPSAAMDWNGQDLTNVHNLQAAGSGAFGGIVSGLMVPAFKYKPNVQNVGSSISMVIDNDLQASIVPGTYLFEFFLKSTSHSPGGFRAEVNFSVAAAGDGRWGAFIWSGAGFAGVGSVGQVTFGTHAGGITLTGSQSLTTPDLYFISGMITVANAGTLALYWAQSTSSATATALDGSLNGPSLMRLTRLV